MNKWLNTYINIQIDNLQKFLVEVDGKLIEITEQVSYYKTTLNGAFTTSPIAKQLYLRLEKEQGAVNKVKTALVDLTKKTNSSIEKEYNQIENHKQIEKVEIIDKLLTITTKKLKMNGENIGNFKITLNPTSFSSLKISNLEYVVDNLDHWHVKNQEPCLGNWKQVFLKYFETGHIGLVVDTIIHYLLSTQDRHAYTSIKSWITNFKAKRPNTKNLGDAPSLGGNHGYSTSDYSGFSRLTGWTGWWAY